MTPFLLAYQGSPTVLVRLDGLPDDEVAALAKAVDDDRCLMVTGYKLYSTYPVFIASLFVYDSPDGSPLCLEGYRDIATADVQDFVVGLGRAGGTGNVRLYAGDPPELIGQGRCTLRIPPFITPTRFPYRPSRTELRTLWLMFTVVAQQLARIPAQRLDFMAAAQTHMAQTQNMTSRSVFDNSGVVTD